MRADAIRVEGLYKNFEAVVAVDGVSFTVAQGETVALLGGNGAGKTTTIAMLLGLLLPTRGSIEILGEDMLRHRFRVLPRMNFSSPYVDLPGRLTLRENLTVYGHLYLLPNISARIAELAASLDLETLLDRKTRTLSAGQKTRLQLAKALINQPDLLLLDEPTASLDPDTADWVRERIETYRRDRGATILLASHNMAEVERLCSGVLMLRGGKIVDQGSPDSLIARYGRSTLEEVFLDIARDKGRAATRAAE
jgi:ABC-2 type transport system ATP-binding protein